MLFFFFRVYSDLNLFFDLENYDDPKFEIGWTNWTHILSLKRGVLTEFIPHHHKQEGD